MPCYSVLCYSDKAKTCSGMQHAELFARIFAEVHSCADQTNVKALRCDWQKCRTPLRLNQSTQGWQT